MTRRGQQVSAGFWAREGRIAGRGRAGLLVTRRFGWLLHHRESASFSASFSAIISSRQGGSGEAGRPKDAVHSGIKTYAASPPSIRLLLMVAGSARSGSGTRRRVSMTSPGAGGGIGRVAVGGGGRVGAPEREREDNQLSSAAASVSTEASPTVGRSGRGGWCFWCGDGSGGGGGGRRREGGDPGDGESSSMGTRDEWDAQTTSQRLRERGRAKKGGSGAARGGEQERAAADEQACVRACVWVSRKGCKQQRRCGAVLA